MMSNVEAKIRRWKTADNDLIKACTKIERRGNGLLLGFFPRENFDILLLWDSNRVVKMR